jgi:trimeric autotransporter adhesin
VRRLIGMSVVGAVAMGAAMLVGAGMFDAVARAQAAAPAMAPAQAAPAPVAAPDLVPVPQGGSIKGTVKAGGVPLPGVAVTATNTLTGKKYATTTDVDGAYNMDVPRNGRYVVKTELTGFAPVTQEVVVNGGSENGGLPLETAEFKMDLASRVTPDTTTTAPGTTVAATGTRTGTGVRTGAATVARVGRGTQALTAAAADQSGDTTDATAGQLNSGTELPAAAQEDASAANESIAVSGQQGQINGLAGFSEDDLRNRIGDMQRQGMNNGDIAGSLQGVMQTGTFGGPGGGPGAGGGFGGPGGGNGFGGPGGGGGGGGFGGGGGGGGFGGGGGGGRGGGGGGGFGGGGFGFRGQNPNAWHGRASYNGSNNALNADSYSVTGTPIPKPAGDRNNLTASFTGTPYIPGLLKPNTKQMLFLSIQESRNTAPSTIQAVVPTLAQRYGDLTPSTQAALTPGTVVPVYDPATKLQYGNTGCSPALKTGVAGVNGGQPLDPGATVCIPQSELTNAGLALLNNYYPLPNIVPTQTGDNYQANIPGTSDSSQISARFNRSFGAAPTRGGRGGGGGGRGGGGGAGGGANGVRQNRNAPPVLRQSIAENFAYSHSASANASFSPTLGGKQVSNGYSLSSGYTVGYGRINSTATLSWSRSLSLATNYFTNGTVNPAINGPGNPGIHVGNPTIYSNPFNYGVPSISLAGGYQGLSDQTPSQGVSQTISFSDTLSYVHKRHNLRFGFDFHRIHADSTGGTNVLGSFQFTGFATQLPTGQTYACTPNQNPASAANPNPTCTTGSSVADLLLGQPQQSGITAGLNKIYLRGNSWDGYFTDDWRAKSNITLEYGLRWEYFSPYSEKYGRLVNLNVTGTGSSLQIANDCAAPAPTGAGVEGTCASVTPGTLVKPDKNLYEPRVAIRWAPKEKFTKQTVFNASYGINFNTGQYSRFAQSLAFQAPFAFTQANVEGTNGCTPANLTLTNGFNCSTAQTTFSNFAVNPNYRLAMLQIYNFGVQRTLPQQIVLNINYTGAFSTNLDMRRAPNRNQDGLIVPSTGQFTYEDSLGYQRSNALAVSASERMHKGVALSAVYTYSHSIDNASSVGGSGNSVAQNDQDLGAEESNSSFDRRHSLTGNFVIEPPFGPNRAFLNKGGVFAKILDGYSISGSFTFASGGYTTPTYALTSAEIKAGAPNSLRPNRAPGVSITGPQTHLEWFNTAAFVPAPLDALGNPTYGNAARNSIQLPGTVAVSGSLSRTVTLGETRSFELRLNANNALNTVQYSGIGTQLNNPKTYGFVTSAAPMRSFSYSAMYRF